MIRLIRNLSILCTAALICSCTGNNNADGGKPTVLASIPPLAAIADAVGGDRIDILTVCNSESDPETFEPTAAQRLRMSKASAYIMAGHLSFEHPLAENLSANNKRLKVVDTSKAIDILCGTHSDPGEHAHDHEADPHTWSSLRNGAKIAQSVCTTLCEIDPAGADAYHANLDSLLLRIHYADSIAAAALASAPSKSFIVLHPSLSYFARDYGLRQIALGIEGKDPTPARMKAAIDRAAANDARIMFVQSQYDSRGASSVNEYINARMVEINPLDSCWIEQLLFITDEISRH